MGDSAGELVMKAARQTEERQARSALRGLLPNSARSAVEAHAEAAARDSKDALQRCADADEFVRAALQSLDVPQCRARLRRNSEGLCTVGDPCTYSKCAPVTYLSHDLEGTQGCTGIVVTAVQSIHSKRLFSMRTDVACRPQ